MPAAFQSLHRLLEGVAVELPFGAACGVQRGFDRAGLEAGIAIKLRDGPRDRRFVRQKVAQPSAFSEEFAKQFGKIVRPAKRGEQRQIPGKPPTARCSIGQYAVARPVQQGALIAFLDDLEMGRHPGLQREAFQHGLAEGMDGLDAHAARHVQAGREQGARAPYLVLVRRPSGHLAQVLAQVGIAHQRPFAEPPGDPVGHFRRRGLGEGEAQDARRRSAVQQ